MLLAVGGNGMHRNPTLFCLELARKPVKELKLCGAALGIAADVLLATGQADTAYFGFSDWRMKRVWRRGCGRPWKETGTPGPSKAPEQR